MSRPLFLVTALPAGDAYTLDGPEGRHAADVQRLGVGEGLLLGDGRGGIAEATVVTARKGALDLVVTGRAQAPPDDPRLVVVQGIAKGDRGERAVQAMTEVGVDVIVPWAAARSVARWRQERGARARDRWVATAREAAKQARRPWVPKVAGDPDESTATVARRVEAAAAAAFLVVAATAQAQSWQPPAERQRCPSKWGAGDERGSGNHMKPKRCSERRA
jgi:16S rRNA (uracil1498-N3)-methyltransferase